MKPFTTTIVVLAVGVSLFGQRQAQTQAQTLSGMVVDVKPSERLLVVSHDPVPGVMPAMIMPFEVRDEAQLRGLTPGTIVNFTLGANAGKAFAENLQVVRYQSGEQAGNRIR
jgi:Cu/Ag efflux protein CusF